MQPGLGHDRGEQQQPGVIAGQAHRFGGPAGQGGGPDRRQHAAGPRGAVSPATVTFEQAASVPLAAVTTLQALRDQAQVRPGQQVLINGASGGVGTFAVQIAKALGAEVTGVCSTRNTGLVKSIGADTVIDYTRDDFTCGTQPFDVILDNVANHPLPHCRRVLTPKGTRVPGANTGGRWLGGIGRIIKAKLMSPLVPQRMARSWRP